MLITHYSSNINLWLINSCLIAHVEEKAKLKKLQMEEKKKNAAFRAKVSL